MAVQQGTTRRAPRSTEPTSKLALKVRKFEEFLDSRPLIDYTMIRSIVLVLAGLGVVMVLSLIHI